MVVPQIQLDGIGEARDRDGDLAVGRGAVAELTVLVVSPALHGPGAAACAAEVPAGDDLDGVEKTLSYAELLPDEAEAVWAFSFRYFQDFNRQVVLPDGFTPQRVKVEVESRTRSIPSTSCSASSTTPSPTTTTRGPTRIRAP